MDEEIRHHKSAIFQNSTHDRGIQLAQQLGIKEQAVNHS